MTSGFVGSSGLTVVAAPSGLVSLGVSEVTGAVVTVALFVPLSLGVSFFPPQEASAMLSVSAPARIESIVFFM